MQTPATTPDRVWLGSYPEGVPADINPDQYPSLVALMEESFARYADRTAYSYMGKSISYRQTDQDSQALAAWFDETFAAPTDVQRAGWAHIAAGRDTLIAAFRTEGGDVNKMFLSRVGDVALDVPDANVAIVISGSGSVREHVQRLGRVLHDGRECAVEVQDHRRRARPGGDANPRRHGR